MHLARKDRVRLARVMSWARHNGWDHDVYPNCWRSQDRCTFVSFEARRNRLVVETFTPRGSGESIYRTHLVLTPRTADEAVNVLATLGYLPLHIGVTRSLTRASA